jgi:hypothetical protein
MASPTNSGAEDPRENSPPLLRSALLLDLEVSLSGTILKLGAVLGDETLLRSGSFTLAEALAELETLSESAACVVGHNIATHDLERLRHVAPHLRLLRLPVLDTLVLSPIAFPENPYHRLVKDYKLVRASVNDPVADARQAGVLFADVNRDGLPDIVIGHHFKQPWIRPVSIRLYLNRGIRNGVPTFEDVTVAAGIMPMAMKSPHVEIQDFDNDGWPDIATSIVKFKDGAPFPVIYKNTGMKDGVPRFRQDAWGVNDFPTKDDFVRKRAGGVFDKGLAAHSITYMAAGPSGDYDRDGRLDIILPTWWIDARTLLLRNETPGGNWLDVQVEGRGTVNRMGVGTKVKVYPAGKLAQPGALLGFREISIGYGFCSGQEAVAHFGLGGETIVDLEISLPHGKGEMVQKGVKANQRLTIRQP